MYPGSRCRHYPQPNCQRTKHPKVLLAHQAKRRLREALSWLDVARSKGPIYPSRRAAVKADPRLFSTSARRSRASRQAAIDSPCGEVEARQAAATGVARTVVTCLLPESRFALVRAAFPSARERSISIRRSRSRPFEKFFGRISELLANPLFSARNARRSLPGTEPQLVILASTEPVSTGLLAVPIGRSRGSYPTRCRSLAIAAEAALRSGIRRTRRLVP